VVTGDGLDFRVKSPAQFYPYDYALAETRFVLRIGDEPGAMLVEDRLRPKAPRGRTFDAQSRATCEEIWTTALPTPYAAASEPLHAHYEAGKLTVEFAEIQATNDNFLPRSGGRITGCVGLRGLRAVKTQATLMRP
jgi:hypothetical protein